MAPQRHFHEWDGIPTQSSCTGPLSLFVTAKPNGAFMKFKEFWNENKKIIGKLILNQFGATFLGIMVVTAASAAQSQRA